MGQVKKPSEAGET
jgi:hypothetical protein